MLRSCSEKKMLRWTALDCVSFARLGVQHEWRQRLGELGGALHVSMKLVRMLWVVLGSRSANWEASEESILRHQPVAGVPSALKEASEVIF